MDYRTLEISREVYHANLAPNSAYEVTVGNIIYGLVRSGSSISLFVKSVNQTVPVLVDVRRAAIYDSRAQGDAIDDSFLSTEIEIDSGIFSDSNEMHRTWIRQQNPDDQSWSLCETALFISGNGARICIWIDWIYKNTPDSVFREL